MFSSLNLSPRGPAQQHHATEALRHELEKFTTERLSPMVQQLLAAHKDVIVSSVCQEFDDRFSKLSIAEGRAKNADNARPRISLASSMTASQEAPPRASLVSSLVSEKSAWSPANSAASMEWRPLDTIAPENQFQDWRSDGGFSDGHQSAGHNSQVQQTQRRQSVRRRPLMSFRHKYTVLPGEVHNHADVEIPAEARILEMEGQNSRQPRRPSCRDFLSRQDEERDDATRLILAPHREDSYMAELPLRTWGSSFRGISSFVKSQEFEHLGGGLVVTNAIVVGMETDYLARCGHAPGAELPVVFQVADLIFTFIFAAEILLRIHAAGKHFLSGLDWSWNLFDCFVVATQLASTISHIFTGTHIAQNISVMRLMRLLRLVRVVRLVRVLRHFHELNTLVSSIIGSSRSLFWTLLLLLMMVYGFSIFFTSVVWNAVDQGTKDAEVLEFWFGSLARTALTLFESITGGCSWDELVRLLAVNIGPFVSIIFCIYICLCVFALLNVVTGIFFEKTTNLAKDAREEAAARQISDLFMNDGEYNGEHVTWQRFNEMLSSEDMQNYFKVINVDPSEALSLFQLLDSDSTGTITPQEMVSGLLRLRGSATALELNWLMSSVHQFHEDMKSLHMDVEQELRALRKSLRHGSAQSARGIS